MTNAIYKGKLIDDCKHKRVVQIIQWVGVLDKVRAIFVHDGEIYECKDFEDLYITDLHPNEIELCVRCNRVCVKTYNLDAEITGITCSNHDHFDWGTGYYEYHASGRFDYNCQLEDCKCNRK